MLKLNEDYFSLPKDEDEEDVIEENEGAFSAAPTAEFPQHEEVALIEEFEPSAVATYSPRTQISNPSEELSAEELPENVKKQTPPTEDISNPTAEITPQKEQKQEDSTPLVKSQPESVSTTTAPEQPKKNVQFSSKVANTNSDNRSMLDVIIEHLWLGIKDGANLDRVLKCYNRIPLRKVMMDCFLMNTVIFCGVSIILQFLTPAYDPSSSLTFLYPFSLAKSLFWNIPMYTIALIFTTAWHTDLGYDAIKFKTRGSNQKSLDAYETRRKAIDELGSLLYKLPLFIILEKLSSLLEFIPQYGRFFSFLYMSWVNAFYAFDYGYLQYPSGATLKEKIEFFERHWTYMLGFGIPFTFICTVVPASIFLGIYASLFPLIIVMAARTAVPKVGNKIPRVQVFYFARVLNEFALHWISKGVNYVQTKSMAMQASALGDLKQE